MIRWFLSDITSKNFVRHNFLANLFDGAIFAFAMSFVSISTVIPVFVKRIGGNNLTIGLIPVLWTIGFNFPQIFIANYTRKFPFKKKLQLKMAILQRLPWLMISMFSLFVLTTLTSDLALFFFLLLFSLAAIGGSLNLPGWFDLISKITPVNIRGRLFALRSIFGALLGISGGLSVNIILNKFEYPLNFSLLFLIAFLLMMLSYIFLILIKEEHPNPVKNHLRYLEFFNILPQLLKHHSNFRNFLISDAFLIAALMAETFYVVNALERFMLPDAFSGKFVMVIMVSMIFGNLLFGFISDKFGHRLNLILAAFFSGLACILALTATSLVIYLFVFVCIAFTTSLIHISRLTIISEICHEKDRPTFVALTNLITSPFVLFGIISGKIADEFGFSLVFVLAGIFALTAGLWMFFRVEEPRKLGSSREQ